ncbi:MAG: electron transfer flavoprotein subunit beta/FixA family protein [Neisseriales bacterium]|nr:MAG: electron transfer flavoprotein subunit beta/FixA family protein [Neisseriales bacterium]
MKILVAVKRVVDHHIQVRAKADNTGADIDHVKMTMNPFDEVALEEAVRQKEAGKVTEVIAVSCGVKQCEDILRTSMAMGADRAIHIETNVVLQPLSVAKLLTAVAKRESPHMVMLGKQAIDDDANQVGQMLAALLGWGQATFVSQMDIHQRTVTAQREIDGGHEILELPVPCVITADLRLNEPRYIKLPNIIAAKKKPLITLSPESLKVDIVPHFRQLKVEEPPTRQPGVLIDDVAELAMLLSVRVKGLL